MESGVTLISLRRDNDRLCFQTQLAPITPFNTYTSRCKLVLSFPSMVHNSSQLRSLIQRTTATHTASVQQLEPNWEIPHRMVSGATHLEASKLCSRCKQHRMAVETTRGWLRAYGHRLQRRETTKSATKSNNRWLNTDVTLTSSLKAVLVAKSAALTALKSIQALTQTTSLIRRRSSKIPTIFSHRLPAKIGVVGLDSSNLVCLLVELPHKISLAITLLLE